MKASELIRQLTALIEEHGDQNVWHEDNECQAYTLCNVTYCKEDDDFQIH